MQYQAPLIDREIFFGNPEIVAAQLSPDGQYISFIKPLKGMLNIWVKKIEDAFESAVPVTNDRNRPVRSYFWSRDSKYIIYVQDKAGDENFHLYALDPREASGGELPNCRNLTDYENVTAVIYSLPKNDPNKIIVGINDRDNAWHDCYSVDIETGDRKLILQNEQQLSGLYFDLKGKLRMATRSTTDGGSEVLVRQEDNWERLLYANLEETATPLRFDREDNFYFLSNVGEPDLIGLYLYNFHTKTSQLIESDPESIVDIENAGFSQHTDELVSTTYVSDKKRIYWRDKSMEQDYNYLLDHFKGAEIDITSMTKDESKFIFYANDDTDLGTAYLFYRDQKLIEYLYTPRPELPTEHMCGMHPVRYTSLDGLEIPAYLTLPKVDNPKDLPAVIYVHGGPWARDYWGYHSFAQFLANRGYVVLQPNFRGSTGYGKAFLNAAINEWGEKMQDDLTAGAKYLAERGYADPNKIAIAGGSYGGYATLAGATFTPDVYAAGVSIVGPSNLFTLLDTIPPYWESARVMFYKRMGDPNTEAGRAQLKRQSPFFHASNIKAPLMVAQGDNDPRVKTSESDQIVIAMRDHNLPVTYINFPDEGHGFANPDNNMAFTAAMEKFLAEHIGGRYQKDIPEHLQQILEKVTVDISTLTMPEIVTEEMLTTPLAEINKTVFEQNLIYKVSLEMHGNNINFDINRTIQALGDTWLIKDYSTSAAGSMSDESIVDKSLLPMRRVFEQGPIKIDYSIDGTHIQGTAAMQGNIQEIDIDSKKYFVIDGPALDTYLSHLPLQEDYSTILNVFDTNSQKFITYRFKTKGKDEIFGTSCWHCTMKTVEGNEKPQELWIADSKSPILMLKLKTMKEMGGAKLRMEYVRNSD